MDNTNLAERILWINAPHFCAGAIFRGNRCVAAAPIIRWMATADNGQIQRWLRHKGYTYKWVKRNANGVYIVMEAKDASGSTASNQPSNVPSRGEQRPP